MPGNYESYRNLPRVDILQPGDILLNKVYPDFNMGAVEAAITWGQSKFSANSNINSKGVYSRQRFESATFLSAQAQGGRYAEHAAVAISQNMLAEAVGEGVVCTPIEHRMSERYVVWRCKNVALRKEAVRIASSLAGVNDDERIGYSIATVFKGDGGALNSNWRDSRFTEETLSYLQAIRDFADGKDLTEGMLINLPSMFCSEFVIACYQAASNLTSMSRGANGLYHSSNAGLHDGYIKTRVRQDDGSAVSFYSPNFVWDQTVFGVDPRAMSPMRMELQLKATPEVFYTAGRFDSESDPVYKFIEQSISDYEAQNEWFSENIVKEYLKILKGEMALGHLEGMKLAVSLILGIEAKGQNKPPQAALLPESNLLYRCLARVMVETGADKMFNFRGNSWYSIQNLARSCHLPRGNARVSLH
jgi:hypothetical protein